MAMTMRAVMEELDRLDGLEVDEVGRTELVQALARAALMGARGNSGVILSQIVRGAAEELASRPGELVDPVLVASAFASAADAAYASVRDPAEGTMLTVFREMAHSIARQLAHLEAGKQRLDSGVSDEQQDAVLAEVLEQAIADGAAGGRAHPRAARGAARLRRRRRRRLRPGADPRRCCRRPARRRLGAAGDHPPRAGAPQPPSPRGQPLPLLHQLHRLRQRARPRASSCRGWRGSATRCWWSATRRRSRSTSTPTSRRPPWPLFEGAGEVTNLDVADMREQIAEREARLEAGRTGVLAVAAGEGLERLFGELGAHVVPGGETLNPSTYELLAGIHEVPAEEVLVLPSSSNVIMAAERACELSEKPARVVAATSQQESLLALVEFDPDAAAAENAERLAAALEAIATGGVAPAARDDAQGRFRKGDAVGFAGEEIVA